RLQLLGVVGIGGLDLDERGPEPVDLGEVPREVADVPAGTGGDASGGVSAVGGRVEPVAVAPNRVEEVHDEHDRASFSTTTDPHSRQRAVRGRVEEERGHYWPHSSSSSRRDG